MAKNRYNMTAKTGEYIEHTDKKVLLDIRKNNPLFKGARIKSSLQAWHDLINIGVIYPPTINTRPQFRRFNVQYDLVNKFIAEQTGRKAIHSPGDYNKFLESLTADTWGWTEPLKFNDYLITFSQPTPEQGCEAITFYDYIADTGEQT